MFSLLHKYGTYTWLLVSLLALDIEGNGLDHAKDNGDIFLVNAEKLPQYKAPSGDNFDEVMRTCNASFSIPMDYLMQFNATGELPDIADKTGMCYIRCFYEKSGLIEDWKLNADKIRKLMWPATGDSIEHCEMQGKSEMNACVRMYMIARCLMLRALVDARNKAMA